MIDGINENWAQCSIHFELRSAKEHPVAELGVAYQPKHMDDLVKIAAAVAPQGWTGAIPLTLAGEWKVQNGDGTWLNGLGWAFVRPDRVERLGAMVNVSALGESSRAISIIAHEIAHALSLPHVSEPDNLMGAQGSARLTSGQCEQARGFAQKFLNRVI